MVEHDAQRDRRFMSLALALGRRGLGNTWPNPAVGALVVRDGDEPVIVGRGWTQPGGRPHAETEALHRAGAAAAGATLYATLEPCSHFGKTPPCTSAIIAAGIGRVVSAIEDPNRQVAGRGHALLRSHGIAVTIGVGATEAQRAHAGHICRLCDGRPSVTLKLALSADGKAGLAGRRPVPITGEAARVQVHLMRAMHDAILVGIGTVVADDPLLTCRLPGMAGRSPVRVVLDPSLRLPLGSALVRTARETPVICFAAPSRNEEAEAKLRACGVEVIRCETVDGRIDLPNALGCLAQIGISRVMVEGGPTIASAFVAADLVDEAVILRAPRPIGPDGIDALETLPLSRLTASPRLRSRGVEAVGHDSMELFERTGEAACSLELSPT